MKHHLFALLLLTLTLLPACNRPAPPAVDTAAIVIAEPSGSMPGEPEIAPPPRPVQRDGKAADHSADSTLAHEGRQLFLKLQCIKCHNAMPNAKGPVLEGFYGTRIPLKGGGIEIVDDEYIIVSIRKPRRGSSRVEGWEAIMPAYGEDQVSDEEMKALVAFIRSLKKGGEK